MAARARMKVLPYLVPSEDRVHASAWVNEEGKVLGNALESWDYNSGIILARKVVIDTSSICKDCGLQHDAVFRLSVTVLSRGSGVRMRCFHQDVAVSKSVEQVSIQTDVGNTALSGSAVIATVLSLVDPGKTPGVFAPVMAGSLLWRHEHELLLEGSGSKFPMEVVNFTDAGWLPENAPWYLEWEPDFLDHPFMGSVRLLVNSTHERVMKAVSAAIPDNEDRAILSSLFYDVGRSLIAGALKNDEFVTGTREWPEGSTARVLADLLAVYFEGDGYATMKQRMTGDPEYFNASLRSKLRLFGYKAGEGDVPLP